MSSGKVFLGIVAGAAAGALLGILFAPAKGSETREKISKKGKKIKDSVKNKVNDSIDYAKQKFEDTKEKVSDFASRTHVKT